MRVWICGVFLDPDQPESWAFCGVFRYRSTAEAACVSADHFVAPAVLDVNLDGPPAPWLGLYHPRGSDGPE